MKYNTILISIILVILISGTAIAQLGIPNQFWGKVTDSAGNPASDGILIIAKISGKDVAATTTKNSFYGYSPIFYVQDPQSNRDGKIIEFFVSDIKVAEHIFGNGATDELNLMAQGNFAPPPNNPGSSGSSGGGGGGGGGGAVITKKVDSTNQTINQANSCTPSWKCSDWLDCSGTIQKRVCTDESSCETEEGKPEQERECAGEELEDTQSSLTSRILGAVIGAGGKLNPFWAGVFIVLIVVVSVIVSVRRRR